MVIQTTVMGMLGACGKMNAHSSNFRRKRKFSDTDALDVVASAARSVLTAGRESSPAIAGVAEAVEEDEAVKHTSGRHPCGEKGRTDVEVWRLAAGTTTAATEVIFEAVVVVVLVVVLSIEGGILSQDGGERSKPGSGGGVVSSQVWANPRRKNPETIVTTQRWNFITTELLRQLRNRVDTLAK
jgi:hypothetical protein